MKLSEILKNTELFEVVQEATVPGIEQCVGRVVDTRLWLDFVKDVLKREAIAMKKEQLSNSVISISKVYFLGGASLSYFWKVACSDTAWLETAVPPPTDVSWAKNFKTEIGPDGFPTKTSLVSTTSGYAIPDPRKLGIG